MDSDIVTIPLTVATVIGAVYLGALQILLNLRQVYVTGEQPSIYPQLTSNSVALLTAVVGIMLVALAASILVRRPKSGIREMVQ